MSDLQRTDRFNKFLFKGFSLSADGIDNPYQFVNKSDHSFL